MPSVQLSNCFITSFASVKLFRLILWPFFWGNVFFKICSSISIVTIYILYISKMFHCLASPVKVLLLLCKAKPAWIKRSIHYVSFQSCFITSFASVKLFRSIGLDLKSFTEAKLVVKQLESWTDGIHLFFILFLQYIYIHWASKETYHFFRATLTKIHCIKINHF